MRTKIFFLIYLSVFLGKLVIAQSVSDTEPRIINNTKEFNFSIFTGFSFLGPKNDMESNMSDSGLGQTRPAGWLGDAKYHPFTRSYPIANIEAIYYFTGTAGISVNSGISNNIEVVGYQDIGIGNYLFLKSEIWSVSLNYTYRSMDKRHNIFIGPSYFIHRVKDTSAGSKSPDNKNMKFGAYIGYSLQIIQKRNWFMAFRANYQWAPKSEIGPFIAEHQLGIATSNPETYTSIFTPAKVSLTGLNVGLCIGLRMAAEN